MPESTRSRAMAARKKKGEGKAAAERRPDDRESFGKAGKLRHAEKRKDSNWKKEGPGVYALGYSYPPNILGMFLTKIKPTDRWFFGL